MKIVITALLILFSIYGNAQIIISGTVKENDTGKGIEGATVKLFLNGQLKAFAITKNEGKYKIQTQGKTEKIHLVFNHISFEEQEIDVKNEKQTLDVILKSKVFVLKEVSIVAPKIKQRGDTLSYLLQAFVGKKDISLEDALKNLPGIEVSSSGKIQYLGKNINNFYIEGMDMLDGRYSLATKNLSAKSVSSVEVLENHQEIKQLQNRVFSDNVAINIKLNKKFDFKPFGSSLLSIGHNKERFLYGFSTTGMFFSPKFQAMSSIKTGNNEASINQELSNMFEEKENTNTAFSMLRDMYQTIPPLPENRYKSILDKMASVNMIKKISKNSTIKSNIDYTNNKYSYSYSKASSYYTPNGNIVFENTVAPSVETHKPHFSIEYKLNDSLVYLQNKLSVKTLFYRDILNTQENNNRIVQHSRGYNWEISNKFSAKKRMDNYDIDAYSLFEYNKTPENTIEFSNITDTVINKGIVQILRGERFLNHEKISSSFNINRSSRLYVPFSFKFSHENLYTSLNKDSVILNNNIKAYCAEYSFTPQYEYNAPNNRFVFRLSFPFLYHNMMYKYNDKQTKLRYPSANPNLYFNYIINPYLSLNLRAGIAHESGDVANFLTQAVQVFYYLTIKNSGVLNQNKNIFTTLRLEFKRPLEFLFVNTQLSYHEGRKNLLPALYVEKGNLLYSNILADNFSRTFTSNFSITKVLQFLRTKTTLSFLYSWNKNEILQQNVKIPFYGQTGVLSANISLLPSKYVQWEYWGAVNKTITKFSNTQQSLLSQSHISKITFYPNSLWQIYTQCELTSKEITTSVYKNITLWDAGITYKFNTFRLQLAFNNLLNVKSYAYTIFNDLDAFSHNFYLKPREVSLTIILFQ